MLSYFKSKISLIHSVARCLCIVIHTVYAAQSKSPMVSERGEKKKETILLFF